MLELHDGCIGYGQKPLIEGAELCLEPGELAGFMAPNGFGKTTLLRVLAGDLGLLESGTLAADGMSPQQMARYLHLVYYAPSDDMLFHSNMSVAFHLEAVSRKWGSGLDIADVAHESEVESFLSKPVKKLSQGMKRQLSLAMAKLSGARYLLLDEPLNALDPLRSERASTFIRGMVDRGAGILLVSHQPEEMDRICDSCLVIDDRKLLPVSKDRPFRSIFHEHYGS